MLKAGSTPVRVREISKTARIAERVPDCGFALSQQSY
jgi:hypothetical protein